MDDEAKEAMKNMVRALETVYPGWKFNVEFYAVKEGVAEFYFRDKDSISNLDELHLTIDKWEEGKRNGEI